MRLAAPTAMLVHQERELRMMHSSSTGTRPPEHDGTQQHHNPDDDSGQRLKASSK
jgi:hypothetical protein